MEEENVGLNDKEDDVKFIILLQPGDIRWTVVSSDIANSDENRENLVFCDFLPATWYQLKVSAVNDAGKTMALYDFATTKVNGGKNNGRTDRTDYVKSESRKKPTLR